MTDTTPVEGMRVRDLADPKEATGTIHAVAEGKHGWAIKVHWDVKGILGEAWWPWSDFEEITDE